MKKNILLFCSVAFLASCKPEPPKDYVTLSGKITNPNDDLILEIRKGKDYLKTITLKEDGSFSDTLKLVEEGKYFLIHNKENASLYLANGDITSFTLNTKEFDETLKFEGGNADKSNFLIENYLLNETLLGESASENVIAFTKQFDLYKEQYNELKAKYKLDTSFTNPEDQNIDDTEGYYLEYFKKKANLIKEFAGKPSANFNNYENYRGGTTSLSDLKGKYVYVDIWATWCGPCKAEIPALKKVEKAYEGKNIEFVSISVDDLKDKEAWKAMVADKELGGIQLFADNSWESDFTKTFKVNSIPRFLLIDPNGNVVSPDAPRPSSAKLLEMLDAQNI